MKLRSSVIAISLLFADHLSTRWLRKMADHYGDGFHAFLCPCGAWPDDDPTDETDVLTA